MIRSIADRETECVWSGRRSRKLPSDIQQTARRKLRQLDSIECLDELRVPRGNRLEQLKEIRPPRYSIRINDQWRITFGWSDGGADDVRIEDYHRG
ncbi:type II toxin-antitoxin system RelE/ParE family toxin [Hephaestia sp. GCM10023244]|uniref:type II toxin-antitoxin system RelE/ParE family toxin n=1 Tax=unclassified Hephaestia TaxID=2631281 RepID=UPI0020775B2D|nr:type II toxin-antitoxin system RelE/ParE family toxin [Hephaestia sp. MAHUQ-44]MCM8731775.1 type II toxin-antitoxin system RelE/ParE family toxin [Hephaestia sp. MAHUQ-44]